VTVPPAPVLPRTCTVIIPTFNERENLPVLVHALMALDGVGVLVVDDASPDGTGAVAEALRSTFGDRVQIMHRARRGGLGSAYVAGMQRALAGSGELIAQMDADLSHDVTHLPAMISAMSGADLAIGSRYVPGGGVANWSVTREWLSRFANRYVRWVTGLPVHDCTAGYRCWRREALRLLPLESLVSNGYAFQVEMTWEAHRRGLRLTEVPILFLERHRGHSKLTWAVVLESILLPWRLRRRQEYA